MVFVVVVVIFFVILVVLDMAVDVAVGIVVIGLGAIEGRFPGFELGLLLLIGAFGLLENGKQVPALRSLKLVTGNAQGRGMFLREEDGGGEGS